MNLELVQYQNANQSFEEVIDNFVVRHHEFARIMDDIRTTKKGASFQHYVFVGRRGSGKSTLLRRIQAEIISDTKLNSKYIAVNLGEEQSGIYRLYDLWDYVIRDLNAAKFDIENLDFRDYKSDMKAYSKALHGQIIKALQAKKKKLILLIDNIDRVLDTRGSNEDAALLRELLINFKDIRIIGGSTVMSEHFWKYDMPFYQFFSIKNLGPLSLEEAEKLLIHWSDKKQLPEIKEIIKTHPGKLQSIRMLTDGMPRTMLLFADMMINRPEQNGYQYLQLIVDRATPIYQERLGMLSPAQKKVLSELAFIWDASTVEELIPKCNMDGKTISALLNQLTQNKNVEKIKGDTKNLLYRLEERFFNLWFNMTQGGPQQRFEARALTDFLEKWYDQSELQSICFELSSMVKSGNDKQDYLEAMSQALLNSTLIASEPKQELYLSIKKSGLIDPKKLGDSGKYFADFDGAISKAIDEKNYNKAIELLKLSNIEEGRKYFGIGFCYYELEKFKEAEKYYLLAVEKENASATFNLARLYQNQGNEKKAEEYYLKAIKKEHVDALFNLAILYQDQGKEKDAEKCYLIAIEKEHVNALYNLALLYQNQQKDKEAEKYYLLAIKNEHIEAINNLAILYENQGKIKKAEKYYLLAIEKGNVNALNNLAVLFENQGKEFESEKYFLLAIEKEHEVAFKNLTITNYYKNKKAKLKNHLQNQPDNIINHFNRNYTEVACVIYLFLGKMDLFKSLSNDYLEENITASEILLQNILIHKQTNWVYNYFTLKPEEVEQFKPLYYATLHLLENKQQELLKMPPEIEENVNDILTAIKKQQEFYYKTDPTVSK